MFRLHFHTPRPMGIMIKAGFRKPNLPHGTYSVLLEAELHHCSCGDDMVKIECCNAWVTVEKEVASLASHDRATVY
jgi:hypothetical protein